MISKTDSLLSIYSKRNIRVKAYTGRARVTVQSARGDAPSDAWRVRFRALRAQAASASKAGARAAALSPHPFAAGDVRPPLRSGPDSVPATGWARRPSRTASAMAVNYGKVAGSIWPPKAVP